MRVAMPMIMGQILASFRWGPGLLGPPHSLAVPLVPAESAPMPLLTVTNLTFLYTTAYCERGFYSFYQRLSVVIFLCSLFYFFC